MGRWGTCRAIAASAVFAAALFAAALGASSAAQAFPLTWNVTGVFDDGGAVSGQFTIDTSGYYDEPTALTTAGSLIGAFDYSLALPNQIIPPTPPAFGVVFYSDFYVRTLQMMFENSLEVASADNPIVISSLSFECDSYCPDSGAKTRFFVSGYASVASATPLPAALLLFAGGLGALALGLSRRRRAAA